MEQLSTDFKKAVADRLLNLISERQSINHAFYKFYGVSADNCLKLRLGRIGQVKMRDTEWLRLGRKLELDCFNTKWKMARTDVFNTIEEDVLFCKEHAKAKICVDECGIGKTFAGKYLAASLPNCFYVDGSQAKTVRDFTRLLAKVIHLDEISKIDELKQDIKCYLKMIDKPIVIIDEAGDLPRSALQEIKGYWNATEGYCGWYLMGADGLKVIIERGIKKRTPGFKEIFSRFSERYTTTVPAYKPERLLFYRKLITDVLAANGVEGALIDKIAARCLVQTADGQISGLRRAESLLLLFNNQNMITNGNEEESACIEEIEGEAVVC